MKTQSRFWHVTYLFLVFALTTTFTALGQEIIVRGLVTDRNYKGIQGVIIRPESNGRPVGQPVQSDAGGNYELRVRKGEDFDLIYNHSAWHPDTFKRLSGNRDHSINKVLYQPGGEADYSATVVLNIFQAYEYIFTAGSVAGEPAERLKAEYGDRLAAIRALPKIPNQAVRTSLEAKRQNVFELFRIR